MPNVGPAKEVAAEAIRVNAVFPGIIHTDIHASGGGELLFDGVDARALGYECIQFVASEKATHIVLRRQGVSI